MPATCQPTTFMILDAVEKVTAQKETIFYSNTSDLLSNGSALTPDAVMCELAIIFESQLVTSSNEILSSVTERTFSRTPTIH